MPGLRVQIPQVPNGERVRVLLQQFNAADVEAHTAQQTMQIEREFRRRANEAWKASERPRGDRKAVHSQSPKDPKPAAMFNYFF